MESDLGAGGVEAAHLVGDVGHAVGRGAEARRRAGDRPPRVPLDRDHEEGGAEPALDFEVAVEPRPGVLGPAEMDQGQRQGCPEVLPEVRERRLAPAGADHGADHGPVEEPEHRVVEPVKTDGWVVHVVGQAGHEPVTRWDGRDLDQGDAGPDDPLTQKGDVAVEGRDPGVCGRLTPREEPPDLLEEVVADPHDGPSVRARHGHGGLPGVLEDEIGRAAVGRERGAAPVHRDAVALPGEHRAVARRTGAALALVVERAGLAGVEQDEPGGPGQRRALVRVDQHVIAPAAPPELPGCLEQLEELPGHVVLLCPRHDADHRAPAARRSATPVTRPRRSSLQRWAR